VRYRADAAQDTGFGVMRTRFGAEAWEQVRVLGLAFAGGRIRVIVSRSEPYEHETQIVVADYRLDGTPGAVLEYGDRIVSDRCGVRDVAFQGDKVIALTGRWSRNGLCHASALVRLGDRGVDDTFARGGRAEFNEILDRLAVFDDQSIMLAGGRLGDARVRRLDANGATMPDFGGRGLADDKALGRVDSVEDVVFRSDGGAVILADLATPALDSTIGLVLVGPTGSVLAMTSLPGIEYATDPNVVALADGSIAVVASEGILHADSRGSLIPYPGGSHLTRWRQPDEFTVDAVVPRGNRLWVFGHRDDTLTFDRVDPARPS
jgi:hypothetical protein